MSQPSRFPGSGPGVRQCWSIVGWALVLLVITLSVTPAPIQVPFELWNLGDKLGHVLAYTVLMFWFANLFEPPAQRAKLAVGFIVMGIVLEFVQRWIGYRSFEVADMAAGAVGVAAGWALAPPRMPNCLSRIEQLFRQ